MQKECPGTRLIVLLVRCTNCSTHRRVSTHILWTLHDVGHDTRPTRGFFAATHSSGLKHPLLTHGHLAWFSRLTLTSHECVRLKNALHGPGALWSTIGRNEPNSWIALFSNSCLRGLDAERRVTALEADLRSSIALASAGVVDMRVLGKPTVFSGDDASLRRLSGVIRSSEAVPPTPRAPMDRAAISTGVLCQARLSPEE